MLKYNKYIIVLNLRICIKSNTFTYYPDDHLTHTLTHKLYI